MSPAVSHSQWQFKKHASIAYTHDGTQHIRTLSPTTQYKKETQRSVPVSIFHAAVFITKTIQFLSGIGGNQNLDRSGSAKWVDILRKIGTSSALYPLHDDDHYYPVVGVQDAPPAAGSGVDGIPPGAAPAGSGGRNGNPPGSVPAVDAN